MTHLTFIRYFVPDGNEFAPGWYQTRNEGRTRIGDVPLSLSDALYDGPNRVIIDDNTPETNSLPVSGGKGVDEFLITRTANSVVIDDDSGANVIVFERDVVITSIERPAGSEGASVAQYVITLSSGKTITLRNPASFTFQHLGDATRTDPISAEDFVTAYEDGFAASDASHPDIIGDASGPSGVQGPMITGTATGAVYEGDPSTSGDLDVNNDTLLASTTPFTISTQGTYGTASIGDDGEWVYKLDNGNTDVRLLNSGDTLTDTFVVDVNLASGRAETQTVTITISGRTEVFGTNGEDRGSSSLGDARTSDNQAIFGFNSRDTLTGGSGDDLLVGGYGFDTIDLSAGGTDTVVYRINSSDPDGLVKAEDGGSRVMEFTPGEDKLVILDVNGPPTTLAGLFDSLTNSAFRLGTFGNDDGDRNLSPSELDAGARAFIWIRFQTSGTDDGGPKPPSSNAGSLLVIYFDRVTSEALNDRAVWDTLTGGTNFSSDRIFTVAQLSSLFGGFGRPGYDAALDDGGFISIIGPDDLPDSYFEIISGAVYEGDPSTSGDLDVNDDTLLASTTPFTISTQGTYGTASIDDDGEWVYKLDNGNTDVRALNSGDTLTDTFVVDVNPASGRAKTQIVTITISGRTDVLGTNGRDRSSSSSLGDASTSDNQAIFGFNSSDALTGGSGDDLLVGGYGIDNIDLSSGGTDTVVYRINSSDGDGLVKAEDGSDEVYEFSPGEDKLVILDVNGSPTTLAGLFDSLTKDAFQLHLSGDADGDRNLSSSELDAGARYLIQIVFQAGGTDDGGPTSNFVGSVLTISFDRVTSEALNDRAVWDTLTGGTNFSSDRISTVAQLSSLFGGFGRPGYDAALDDGGFISIIGPDDLPDSYFFPALNVDTSGSDIVSAVYEGDPSTSGDLDVNDHTLLASTTPFTISTQGTYGTASIGDDGEWVYKLDNGNADVRALNSGDTLTDTFVVDVNPASGRAKTQTITITISGRTDVFGTNGGDTSLGDASTSDNQAIFGFNYGDTLRGGSGDDLLVGGYGADRIDLSAGGTDTVVYRINSSYIQGGARLVKAEDGTDTVFEFTPGEDKLVILDVNESPMTLAGFFDSLTKHRFQLRISRDDDRSGDLSSSELDAGARYFINIVFQAGGTVDGDPASTRAGRTLRIDFDRVTSEALNDRAVWDTLTGGTNFSESAISTVAQLSSLFGGFGRPGYDAALDDGGFISIIGPDDLPDSYFVPVLNVDTSGSDIVSAVYEGDLSTSGDLDVNNDTLLASTTPFTISTQGTYGTASIGDDGEWVYKLDNGNTDVRALNSGDTLTDTFVVDVNLASGRAETQTVTITISGRTEVFGTNGREYSLGDASTSDNQAIFGFNYGDRLTGGSGDDLLVGGYGNDVINLSAGGADTVVYRINSSDDDGLVKAEDGDNTVFEFTPGEDKLVILDINGSPTTLAGLFDSLTKDAFLLFRHDDDALDAGFRAFIRIVFQVSGTRDGGSGGNAGNWLEIYFDRVTSEALNDRAVWDTLTGGTNFSSNTISTVAQLSSLFGGFGRPGYDAALDDGGFISIIGPDDLPDSYFESISGAVYEGDLSTSGDLDVNDDTLLASTTPFTISTQGTYGTASIGDDGEWVYKLDNGNTDVRALNSGDTLTDTFVVDVNPASGRAKTQIVTITISGRTDVLATNGNSFNFGDFDTSDNQAIFGFNSRDRLEGGSGDDLLVGGYGEDDIDLSAGGTDTVVYRINSSYIQGGARLVKAEDGEDRVREFTPGEDKLVILDVNGSPTTLAGLFDSLDKDYFALHRRGDDDRSGDLSSSELDAGARYFIQITFQASGTDQGGPTSRDVGSRLIILFDRVTSEALNDRAVWDTLTGGTNFSSNTISTVAQLSSLFGGFGRPGYDAALDDGGFISIIGPDDLPESYFAIISGDETGSVTEGGAPGDDNTGTLTAPSHTITLVSKETTDSRGTSTGTYGVMRFNASSGEWVYTLDDRAEALADQQTATETFIFRAIFIFSAGRFVDVRATFGVTITVTGANDAPVVESGNEIVQQAGRVGQEIEAIDLSGLFTDVDTGDALTLTVMVLSSDGNTRTALDTLGLEYDSDIKMITGTLLNSVVAGPYTIEVIATDGSGDESQPSTFDIVVAPDIAPVIGGDMYGTIAEDAADPLMGTLSVTDAEGDLLPTVMLSDGAGQYGMLTFVASAEGGVWTYTLNNANAAVQALVKDATLTEEFTFTAEGAAPITVTITISGVNEAPGLVPGAEIEDQDGNVGQLIDPISESDLRARFVDADTDNAALVLTVMVLASDGTRSGLDTIGLGYNSTDGITGTPSAAGTYTIEVTASDGEESIAFTFDIVVVHPPVIGNDSPTEIGEDAGSPITGRLTITDQDSSTPFRPIALTDDSDGTDDGIVKGEYGTLTFDSNTGAWSYMVDDRAQVLNDDTPGTDRFVFTSEGATDFELVITVTGANDDPAIAMVDDGSGTGTLVSASIGDQSGTEGEDTVIDLSGVFIDPDDVLNVVPTATLDPDGVATAVVFDGTTNSFSYDPDTEMLTITLAAAGDYTVVVTASDGRSGSATTSLEFALNLITQTISGATTGAVTEDDNTNNTATGVLQSAGTITLSDDADGNNSVDGTYGTIVFNPNDGTWVYTLDNVRDVTQNLPGGETEEDRFIFTDGTAELTVVITVTGANDAPVVESGNEIGEQAGRVGQEIEAIDLSGLFTDVDTGDALTLTVMVLASDGSKSGLDTLGLEYDSDTKMITGTLLNNIDAGTYTIEVIATDGSGAASAPSTFNIVVAPDNAPVIGGDVDGTIAEDAADPLMGTLTITDAEGDALPTVALTNGAGQYGTLTFVASAEGGVWTYTLDNTNAAVQALKGDTLTDEFTFTAEGAAPITVTITISGVNDAPTVSGEFFNREGTTGGQFTLSNLSDRFTDVDEGDELTFEVTLDDGAALSTIGLTYNSDEDEITGTLTRSGTYVIKIVATDKSGATVEATFVLNILAAIPIIQRNSLTYNPDATSITIDETMLKVTSDNQLDPTLLVYTITTLPDAGMLLKSGTPLNNGDTFTQADINNGLITYVPNVSSPHTSQSNPLSFTFSDGVVSLEEQTLEITSREVVGNTAYEGDLSTSGDLDVNDDTLLASTTPFTISTQGTYGTASIGDDGEWVYKLDNGNADVRALNSGDTLTDTFVVDVNLASGRAKTQIVTITISGRTDVLGTNGRDNRNDSGSDLGDASTSDNQAIFGFNSRDTLTGGSGDDLLVGGYGADRIDLSAGGTDTVVYRINSSYIQGGARLVKAEDGTDTVFEFTPGEDKLVILDVNGSPMTLAGFFDSLTKHRFQLRISRDADRSGDLSSSELDAGARYLIQIVFDVSGTDDGGSGANAGHRLIILFDRVTSEALNDRAVWDTLTGGTNFSSDRISTVAQLSSLFGGFGRPGYDAALDDGGFISIIGPDDLPDSYFAPVLNVDTSGSDIVSAVYEGDPSTSGDLDVNNDTLLASTTPFTISTQGTYGTASIGDDGEWVYKLDNGNADVRALNSGDTLTDTFVVDVNPASGRAKTQTITITISGRTEVFGTNGDDTSAFGGRDLGDANTSDNQAIFGFNSSDYLAGGSGDDLLVGGYGRDFISLSRGGTDTVVYRINSSDTDGLVKAEDGGETVFKFTPGEDKLVILDVNGSPTTLAGLFDSLTKDAFQLNIGDGDTNGDHNLSSSELDAGARYWILITFQASGTVDGGPTSPDAGRTLWIVFDRVTSEALNDMAVWDTLTGGTNFSSDTISTVAQLNSLFGGFGRPGYDAALDDGGFISIIGPDDLPDSYFEFARISGDETGSVTEGGAPGDDNTGTLTASGSTITLTPKETTDSPGMSTGTYGVMRFNASSGEWVYTLDDRAEALADQQTATESFIFSAGGAPFEVTITITGANDAPVVESGNEIVQQAGRVGQEIEAIDLSGLFTDVDTGDTLTLTVMVLSSDGNTRTALDTLGLEYDSDIKMITGTLLNSVVAGPYTIEVIATDGSGDESQPSTFDIVVAPDIAPVIGGAVDGSIAEDAADPLMGTLSVTDAEGDPLPTVMLSDGAGQYGMLTFVASAEGGVWTYTLNNANAAVQALVKDATLTEEFTFTAEGAAPITVTITISGVNDAPGLVPGAEIEDQDGNVGQLIDPISESDLRARFVDADTDNAALVLTVMVLASDGTRSGLDTIGLGYNSTDGITGTPSAAGTYTIEVTASDGEESIAFTFDIVVVHPPVIGNDSPTEIGEDAGSPITGRLTITDQDSSAPFRPIALTDDSDGTDDGIVKGEYGTLTFDSNTGAWSYMVDERAQALNDDTPGTDRFVFTSEGATDFELVITVTGSNDAPEIAKVDDGDGNLVDASIDDQSGTEGEDTIIDLSGVFIDPDDVLNVVPTATLDSDGTAVVFDGTNNSFSYDPDTEMLTINLADIGEYTISVEATDGGTGPAVTSEFTFTVVEQQISGDSEGSVTEDDPGNTPAMGTLTRSNASTSLELTGEGVVNDGAGTFTREGKYGTMTFVASASGGTWSYVLDNTHVDVQGLGIGDTLSDETFVFTTTGVSSDFTVTITIEGANDAPVLARSQGTIEGQTGQTLESINLLDLFNDPDGDELELTVTATFNESAISLDDAGFTHTINDEDQTQTFSGAPQAEGTYVITVVAEDEGGATATSTFTINAISGTRPQLRPLSGNQPTLNEDETSLTGRLVIYDEERDPLPDIVIENADVSGVFRGLYGSVSIEKTGETDAGRAGSEIWEWTYTLDERAQALGVFKEGDPIPFETFSFIPEGVPGAANAQIEIRIVGANDAPVVDEGVRSVIDGQTRKVDKETPPIDLSALFRDPEGDEITLQITSVTFGGSTVELSTTGFVYNSTDKTLSGAPNAAGDYVITIVATDSNNALSDAATFTISAVEDNPPEIGGTLTGTLSEDRVLPLTGVLTIEDADEGDTPPAIALVGDGVGQYGMMTFDDSDNTWSYLLSIVGLSRDGLSSVTEVNTLAADDTLTETFTFAAQDASPVQVVITISGVNDAPVVESEIAEQAGRVGQEITAIDLSGLFTDVDTGDTFTLTVMVLSSDGSTKSGLDTLGLEYDSDTKMITGTLLNSVIVGTYTIEVIATDGGGGGDESQPSTFDIVIAPDNAPVIGGAMDGSIDEDAADPITGTLTITDADDDALPTVALTNGVGQYGTLTFVASAEGGVWTYRLNNANADVQALKDDTLTDEFTFTAEGADPITVTITISGANDAPTVSREFINREGTTGGQFTLSNLSDQFTDVDQGDELTFEVTLDDDRPLSTIGLTYDSDEDEITGTLTEAGTYVIKIVATDKSGTTVEATFDLSIVPAIPEIQRSSLTYNPDETSITIDETMLKVTSGNESDPALLVYTITTLPDAGKLLKSGTQLNDGDTFTQADINNGLITYVPNVSSPSTSQSNPLSFTFSDGVETLEEQTLQITSREVFEDADADADEDNLIDLSGEAAPQKIEAGDGSDIITGGDGNDQIDGGAGDDEIILTRTVGDVEEDAGADEVLYTFSYDGVGIDGGDEIVGFKRGQDKLTFVVDRNFDSLTEFLQSLNGADGKDLTDDDAFIVTMVWGLDTDGAFYFDGVLLHFKEGTSFGGGRIFSPVVQITFDERLGLHDLIEILGGAENVANNFDGGLTAFKNLDEVLPRLFGEGSIGFKGVDPSGTNGASERASEEPQPPIYETLSEQLDDDLQPTSFELGGGEPDII